MIIDQLTLHNFGAYRGRHPLALTTTAARPIVLIGGMNGAGKTTLLDALQLVLYGKRSPSLARGRVAYQEVLRRSINHEVAASDGASLELEFRMRQDGVERRLHLHRSWSANGRGARETVEVFRDGQYDKLLSEQWDEYVEGLLPVGLSAFYFFDGEQVERYAELGHAQELLRVGLSALLGLDVIEQLRTDLGVLVRRKSVSVADDARREEIKLLTRQLKTADAQREELLQRRAAVQNDIERREHDVRRLEAEFRARGGELFEERSALAAQLQRATEALHAEERHACDVAAGSLPLLLIVDRVSVVREQAGRERSARDAERLRVLLRERDRKLLEHLKRSGASDAAETVRAYLKSERAAAKAEAVAGYLMLDEGTEQSLSSLDEMLARAAHDAFNVVRRVDALREEIVQVERRLQAVPDEARIREVREQYATAELQLERSRASLAAFEEDLGRITGDVERLRRQLDAVVAAVAQTRFSNDDDARLIHHASLVQKTMDQYRERLVERRVSQIRSLVLDSLRQLLRKQTLIEDLLIDARTLELTLLDGSRRVLLPDRLSAGERQILSVALLWGLARAAGRPLPTVIDTPLGRLDSSHREHLVRRYFPVASHQVILLSTDEEVNHRYYGAMSSAVARQYLLSFNEDERTSQIHTGYFWSDDAR